MNWDATDLDVLKEAEERLKQINRELEESRVRRIRGLVPHHNQLIGERSSLDELIGDDHG